MSAIRRAGIVVIWLFPYLLATGTYFAGAVYEPALALRTPVLQWPVPQPVYGGLLVLLLIAITWLIGEFFSVTSRETVVTALQFDAVFSTTAAILFTGAAGWLIGTGRLEWWFVVPWIATIIDALTAGWLSVNNAAQKPFMSQKGTV
ncbi:MAG: hypothetical protein K8F92_13895 [Hyphomicrobium sp.]|nr:MAG: hypothetical protein F9K20_02015 [Hyphomicrobium sp.]MBZ0210734.1 hypothetical protein [Hyphomicrobium sp.]